MKSKVAALFGLSRTVVRLLASDCTPTTRGPGNILGGMIIAGAAAAFSGCSNNLYFGTSTSVGLSVAGTAKVPTKVSFAHDRTETAIVPDDSSGKAHSTFAALDSEWTWFNGFVVKQQFATGAAADEAARSGIVNVNYSPPPASPSDHSLVFVTSSKLGVALDFGETLESPSSLLVGYRRHEGTIIPDVRGKPFIDPVYADISIIADDTRLPADTAGPRIGGTRVKQRFATGVAAMNAVTDQDTRDSLRKAVLGDPVLESLANATTRFQKEGALHAGLQKLPAPKQAAYLASLNQAFSRTAANPITAPNFQTELAGLNDTQIDLAGDLLRKL